MEFIDSYVEALKGEYLFLKEYYQVFKMKNSGMPKHLLDKLFHEEIVELIKSEQVGEDSYRLVVLTEKLDIKLPSILDGAVVKSAPAPSKSSVSPTPKKPSVAPPPISKPVASSVDPCSRSSSSYGARSC